LLLEEETDLVVTIGGDGTILHVSSLFDSGAVPPVLSFSLGTLGFLLPFNIENMEQVLAHTLQPGDGGVELLERMRLSCEVRAENGEAVSRCPGNGT
jgi:NADH kinase